MSCCGVEPGIYSTEAKNLRRKSSSIFLERWVKSRFPPTHQPEVMMQRLSLRTLKGPPTSSWLKHVETTRIIPGLDERLVADQYLELLKPTYQVTTGILLCQVSTQPFPPIRTSLSDDFLGSQSFPKVGGLTHHPIFFYRKKGSPQCEKYHQIEKKISSNYPTVTKLKDNKHMLKHAKKWIIKKLIMSKSHNWQPGNNAIDHIKDGRNEAPFWTDDGRSVMFRQGKTLSHLRKGCHGFSGGFWHFWLYMWRAFWSSQFF